MGKPPSLQADCSESGSLKNFGHSVLSTDEHYVNPVAELFLLYLPYEPGSNLYSL
jgi:hypothetical protein